MGEDGVVPSAVTRVQAGALKGGVSSDRCGPSGWCPSSTFSAGLHRKSTSEGETM